MITALVIWVFTLPKKIYYTVKTIFVKLFIPAKNQRKYLKKSR